VRPPANYSRISGERLRKADLGAQGALIEPLGFTVRLDAATPL
jgi:hypothetical protein